jgi:outer membrane protein OmpA-like peptidoglycan-associated protein
VQEAAPVIAAEPAPEQAPSDPVVAAEPAPPPAEPVQEAAPPPKKRKKVAEEPPADTPQAAAPEAAPAEPVAEAPPATGPEMDEALAIVNDPRAPSELSADELKERLKRARTLARNKTLPEDLRAALDKVAQQSRKALLALEAGGQGGADAPPKVAQPEQPPAPEKPVAEQPPVAPEQPVAEQPAAPADAPATAAEAPPPPAKDAPPPAAAADIAAPPPDLAAKPKVVVADETQAAAVIADTVAPAKLDNDALKDRMEAQRELLEDGTISAEKAKVLRSKLKTDREALRARIATEQQENYTKAQAEAKASGTPPPAALAAPIIVAPTAAEVPKILRDEREASVLDEVQLNRRIRAFRQVVRQPSAPRAAAAGQANGRPVRAPLDPRQLAYIEDLEQDRAELRRRLIAEKRQRRTVLLEETETRFEINIDLSPPRKASAKRRPPPPSTVWAAEAEDDEIERYLVARPIRRMPQQYVAPRRTVMLRPEAYVTRPEVRELLPSVEIDTISFGFGEAFVREEEVINLDRIALVMERILDKHPEEVFLIEGHTDAVGSDGYNLRLSKQRAEAIKRALTDYYVIPASALTTVGLGERYLKIWTPDPEQENRRVTLRRITAVMSDYDSGGADPY